MGRKTCPDEQEAAQRSARAWGAAMHVDNHGKQIPPETRIRRLCFTSKTTHASTRHSSSHKARSQASDALQHLQRYIACLTTQLKSMARRPQMTAAITSQTMLLTMIALERACGHENPNILRLTDSVLDRKARCELQFILTTEYPHL